MRVHGGWMRATVRIVTSVESREVGEKLMGQICRVLERHGFEVALNTTVQSGRRRVTRKRRRVSTAFPCHIFRVQADGGQKGG